MTQVILETLTPEEQRRRDELERAIKRGVEALVEMGAALAEIRDRRLWRSTHVTFDAYCQDMHGFGDSRARQLVGAYQFVQEMDVTVGNERQARALKAALNEYPTPYHIAIMHTAKSLAAQNERAVSVSDVRAAGTVITQVATTGAVDLGDGDSTPITAALTQEQYEIAQRQREHMEEMHQRRARPFQRFIAPVIEFGGGTMTFSVGALPLDWFVCGENYEVTVRKMHAEEAQS